MSTDNRPIGVLDSGLGGISVLRELVKLMPGEDFIYYGDSANAPYGTRTPEEVIDLTKKDVEFLLERGAKAIVESLSGIAYGLMDPVIDLAELLQILISEVQLPDGSAAGRHIVETVCMAQTARNALGGECKRQTCHADLLQITFHSRRESKIPVRGRHKDPVCGRKLLCIVKQRSLINSGPRELFPSCTLFSGKKLQIFILQAQGLDLIFPVLVHFL